MSNPYTEQPPTSAPSYATTIVPRTPPNDELAVTGSDILLALVLGLVVLWAGVLTVAFTKER